MKKNPWKNLTIKQINKILQEIFKDKKWNKIITQKTT